MGKSPKKKLRATKSFSDAKNRIMGSPPKRLGGSQSLPMIQKPPPQLLAEPEMNKENSQVPLVLPSVDPPINSSNVSGYVGVQRASPSPTKSSGRGSRPSSSRGQQQQQQQQPKEKISV